MGRWASDCYRNYCRLSKERLLEQLSHKMGSSQSSQFANGSRGSLGTLMQFEPAEKRPPDDDNTGGATAAETGLGGERVRRGVRGVGLHFRRLTHSSAARCRSSPPR